MKYLILCLSLVVGAAQAGKTRNDVTVKVLEAAGIIQASIGDKAVFTYHMADMPAPADLDPVYRGNGFIHPLKSPNGKTLSDPYPVDHAHQHSLFNAWTKTTFHGEEIDFWNVQKGAGYTHHAEFLGLIEAGDKRGFKVRREQVSRKHGVALTETWEVLIHPSPEPFLIDFRIVQKAATREPVVVEAYHYGGFAYRGAAEWNSEDTENFQSFMKIMTPQTEDLMAANHSRPDWIIGYGQIDGDWAGVAILDHPDNFRYPQPVRVHPKMPYFVFTPPILGPFTLEPGFQLVSRFRVVLFDGKPSVSRVESWMDGFARQEE
jgi:hypothetical protein